jgi:hypothetical protein
MRAIYLAGQESALSATTPSTVGDSQLVRCVATTIGVVTRKTAAGTGTGSCTVITTEATYINKDPGDTLTASGTILAAPVVFVY